MTLEQDRTSWKKMVKPQCSNMCYTHKHVKAVHTSCQGRVECVLLQFSAL